jgi:hypothetical protein
MVAALGETTAGPVLPRLLDHMLESEEGRRILKERPRINTSTVDMATLARLPENTFGHTYLTWLDRCGVTPDTREPVRFSTPYNASLLMSIHTGALHRRPRACVCHAAIPRVPRFLPRTLWSPCFSRIRARAQGVRICQSRPAVCSVVHSSRRPPECHQTRALPLRVRTLGIALWERITQHDNRVLGRAVGSGPQGA